LIISEQITLSDSTLFYFGVSAFSTISWQVQVNFQSDDDDQGRVALDQHA
jgi:hypothetical protein